MQNVRNLKYFISQITGRTVVMSDGEYVYFDTLDIVKPEIIEEVKSLQITEEQNIKIQEEKDEAQKYLDSTDWYITRRSDIGKEIPEEVKTKRDEARLQIK